MPLATDPADDDRIKRAALDAAGRKAGYEGDYPIHELVDLDKLHVVRGTVIGVTESVDLLKSSYPNLFRRPGGTPPRDSDQARHGAPGQSNFVREAHNDMIRRRAIAKAYSKRM
jgi:hypothetical protein